MQKTAIVLLLCRMAWAGEVKSITDLRILECRLVNGPVRTVVDYVSYFSTQDGKGVHHIDPATIGHDMRKYNIVIVSNTETDTDVIRGLAKKGKICAVYGHWWEEIETNYIATSPMIIEHIRGCRLCGKKQHWDESTAPPPEKWEDWK